MDRKRDNVPPGGFFRPRCPSFRPRARPVNPPTMAQYRGNDLGYNTGPTNFRGGFNAYPQPTPISPGHYHQSVNQYPQMPTPGYLQAGGIVQNPNNNYYGHHFSRPHFYGSYGQHGAQTGQAYHQIGSYRQPSPWGLTPPAPVRRRWFQDDPPRNSMDSRNSAVSHNRRDPNNLRGDEDEISDSVSGRDLQQVDQSQQSSQQQPDEQRPVTYHPSGSRRTRCRWRRAEIPVHPFFHDQNASHYSNLNPPPSGCVPVVMQQQCIFMSPQCLQHLRPMTYDMMLWNNSFCASSQNPQPPRPFHTYGLFSSTQVQYMSPGVMYTAGSSYQMMSHAGMGVDRMDCGPQSQPQEGFESSNVGAAGLEPGFGNSGLRFGVNDEDFVDNRNVVSFVAEGEKEYKLFEDRLHPILRGIYDVNDVDHPEYDHTINLPSSSVQKLPLNLIGTTMGSLAGEKTMNTQTGTFEGIGVSGEGNRDGNGDERMDQASGTTEDFGINALTRLFQSVSIRPSTAQPFMGMNVDKLIKDVGSAEPILPGFGGPLANRNYQPCSLEAAAGFSEYNQPYDHSSTLTSPGTNQQMIEKLPVDTLFYIFYNLTGDALQLIAAKELFRRGWRYHKLYQVWLTRIATAGQLDQEDQEWMPGYYNFFDFNDWCMSSEYFGLYDGVLEGQPVDVGDMLWETREDRI